MVHLFLRKKDGSFAARQDVRLKWPGPDHFGPFGGFGRAVTNPHLLDWNRDGHTDLVIGYTQGGWHDAEWTLYVGTGPLAGKTEVLVKPFKLPKVPDAIAEYFGFADWDGDGRFDLLAAVLYQKGSDAVRGDPLKRTDEPVSHAIYWFRNTTDKGEPKFAAPSRLLTIPAPWELDAFSVDRGPDGRLDLVVSVSKNLRPNKSNGYFAVDSQLWRYRRKG
jgi:hypothetical protein